jgi:hypothetical protein
MGIINIEQFETFSNNISIQFIFPNYALRGDLPWQVENFKTQRLGAPALHPISSVAKNWLRYPAKLKRKFENFETQAFRLAPLHCSKVLQQNHA